MVFIAVTTPALVGICLGATLFLVTVAAVTCFCYRRHSMLSQCGKKGIRGGLDKPLALQQHRRSTAVKSPAGSAGTHYLKKSPSPTGSVRSPPGVRQGLPAELCPMRLCLCRWFLCPFLADTNFFWVTEEDWSFSRPHIYTAFWIVSPCSSLNGLQLFGGKFQLHLSLWRQRHHRPRHC
jgi:hypothetical protein